VGLIGATDRPALLLKRALPNFFCATSLTSDAVLVPGLLKLARPEVPPPYRGLLPDPPRAASVKKSLCMLGAGSWRGCSMTSAYACSFVGRFVVSFIVLGSGFHSTLPPQALSQHALEQHVAPRLLMAAPPRRSGVRVEDEVVLQALLWRLLDQDPVDILRLREVAATHGLVNAKLRARAWPKLLGVDPYEASTQPAALAEAARGGHPDAATVLVDVERCAWLPREGLSGAALAARRAELVALVNGAVCFAASKAPAGTSVLYFQGLHDVAAVLLLTCGASRSGACLVALLRGHLRDCCGASLAPVLAQLELLQPLLARADPQLAAFLSKATQRSGPASSDAVHWGRTSRGDPAAPPLFNTHFAVSWCLTWFAYSAPDLPTIARLFDLFLASSPLMPLYLGVSAMAAPAGRAQLLRTACEHAEVHRLLTALPSLSRGVAEGGAGASALVRAARQLAAKLPPTALGAALDVSSPGHAAASWPLYEGPSSSATSFSATQPLRPDRVLKRLAQARAEAAGKPGGGAAGATPHGGTWGVGVSPQGGRYAGQLTQGQRRGLGAFSQPGGGERYEGQWAGDARHGVGVNTWADGACYAGDWQADRLHGYGVFSWPSGRAYSGEFKDDRRAGFGVLKAAGETAGRGARFLMGREVEREGSAIEGDAAPSARRAERAACEAHAAAHELREQLRVRRLLPDDAQRQNNTLSEH